MSFADRITPPDTEEIKPGVFLQKRFGKYRLIHPAAWEGKMNWKNFIFGGNPLKHLAIFLFIVFLVWAYQNDVQGYQDFYERVRGDPLGFCEEVKIANDVTCTDRYAELGLCNKLDQTGGLNLDNLILGDLNESS